MKRGVLYFASGEKYLKECIRSVKSFKKLHKNIPVCLITSDKDFKSRYFDIISTIEDLDSPFKTKVFALSKSPFEYTLFVDTDITFLQPVYELFDFLYTYDIGIANRVKCKWTTTPTFIDYIDPLNYNTGVVLYRRNGKVDQFFEVWKELVFKQDASKITAGVFCDQHYFNHMVFEKKIQSSLNLKIVEIPNKKYNARPFLLRQLKLDNQYHEIKILHMHIDHTFKGRLKDIKTKIKQKYASLYGR